MNDLANQPAGPVTNHAAFDELRRAHIQSLDIDVTEYRHRITGAMHVHLAADNPENVFLVGLRTVPTDSTGVAHILEHTVLCGSEKYPVRDPFFMMIRRSLNTFMNAFTSSDWTAYPFATQSRKDYDNLLDVYLDAVFFSRLHELDFAQEGHRLEFDTADDPTSELVFKGVVFNEMKGAMSAATSVLWQTMSKHLFANNTYHYNSGGDPEAIPDLSYEQLLAFYRTHYHPSNAVFMTYGNIPAAELQARFEDQVLTRFDPLDRTIRVRPAQRYHAPIRVEEAYASSDENLDDKTHVVLGWLLGESIDLDKRLEAHLLSSVLMDNSASPLMRALEQTELGSSPSPLCGVEDSALEMVMVCGLEGSRPERSDATEQLIDQVLGEVAEHGVPQSQIEAVLHQLELSQREIRGDGMPFGLQLVLSGLSAAMQRGDTLAAIDLDPALARLREKITDRQFIPRLVRELLLDNPHRVRLTLRPDDRISERREIAERLRLTQTRQQLDDAKAAEIVQQAALLAERQLQEDDPEILPKVTLADVPTVLHIPDSTAHEIAGAPAVCFAQGTNGLVYQQVVLDMPALDEELRALVPLYTSFLSELGSGGRDYLETQNRQAEVTGGLSAFTLQRGQSADEQAVTGYFALRGKALLRNSDALSELMHETLTSPRFDEAGRIRELVAQTRASREQSVTGSGHVLAMMAAASGMSPTISLSHRLTGLAGTKAIKALDDELHDKASVDRLTDAFRRIHAAFEQAPRRFLLIAEEENLGSLRKEMAGHFNDNQADVDFQRFAPAPVREQVRQLWTTSTEVNFCARAYPTVPSAHEDSAALNVLGSFLRNGYLHRAIRETGGAYGGGASQDNDTASFRFFSYRDPRLTETLDDFDGSIRWLLETRHEPQALEEAILNVISSIDKPGSPAGEARSAYHAELFGRSAEQRRAYRQRILGVSLDDLRRVGETWFSEALGQEPTGDRPAVSTAVITSAKTAARDDVAALGLSEIKL